MDKKLFRVEYSYLDGESEYTVTYFFKCTIRALERCIRDDLADFSGLPVQKIKSSYSSQEATAEEDFVWDTFVMRTVRVAADEIFSLDDLHAFVI